MTCSMTVTNLQTGQKKSQIKRLHLARCDRQARLADVRLFAPRSLNRRPRVVTSTHGGRMQSAKRRLACVTHRSRVALMDCDDKFAGVGDHASSRLV